MNKYINDLTSKNVHVINVNNLKNYKSCSMIRNNIDHRLFNNPFEFNSNISYFSSKQSNISSNL